MSIPKLEVQKEASAPLEHTCCGRPTQYRAAGDLSRAGSMEMKLLPKMLPAFPLFGLPASHYMQPAEGSSLR